MNHTMKAYRILRTLLLFAVVSVCCTEAALAQDKQNMFNPVNSAVTSLAIAPDARGGGMGDIGAATEADAYSQYWNPAKYPFNIARAGVGISYTPWLRKLVNDINLANLVGFYRIGDYSAVHASLRYFSLGEVFLADMDDMTIKPYELAFDAGYSRMLSETFSMAVNLRFILSDIKYDYTAESSAGKAFAADIALYRLGYFMAGNRECSFGWGLNISNIGSKITYGGSDNSEFIPTNLSRTTTTWTACRRTTTTSPPLQASSRASAMRRAASRRKWKRYSSASVPNTLTMTALCSAPATTTRQRTRVTASTSP